MKWVCPFRKTLHLSLVGQYIESLAKLTLLNPIIAHATTKSLPQKYTQSDYASNAAPIDGQS